MQKNAKNNVILNVNFCNNFSEKGEFWLKYQTGHFLYRNSF